MIKSINELVCINCGLCENICPTDVFRSERGKVYIAYQNDCCNCMQCLFICPVDAVILAMGVPKKFDASQRWKQVKKELGVK